MDASIVRAAKKGLGNATYPDGPPIVRYVHPIVFEKLQAEIRRDEAQAAWDNSRYRAWLRKAYN